MKLYKNLKILIYDAVDCRLTVTDIFLSSTLPPNGPLLAELSIMALDDHSKEKKMCFLSFMVTLVIDLHSSRASEDREVWGTYVNYIFKIKHLGKKGNNIIS